MEDALWRRPDDPGLPAAIARVWRFADRICPLHFPPGVHKHRSVEEAQKLREIWQDANFSAFWERRKRQVAPRR
jgi:hypothetical protein